MTDKAKPPQPMAFKNLAELKRYIIPKEHGSCFCTWATIPDLLRTICAAL